MSRRRRVFQIIVLSIVPLLLACLGFWFRWVTEDAFIDFRVVQHLLAGHGPVFNMGELVEAYTNALWIALLAAVAAPMRPFLHERVPLEWIAVILGLASSVAGIVLAQLGALRLARARGRVGWALPAGALAMAALPPTWTFSTSGLETGLAMGWLGLCFWGCVRYPWSGRRWLPLVVGLGPLIRPDMGIYSAGFLLVLVLLEDRKRRRGVMSHVRVLAAAAALPLSYQIFRMGYFAAIVPNTALAKEASSARWDQGIVYLADFARPYWLPIPLVLALSSTLLGVRSIFASVSWRRRRLLALTLAPIACGLLHAAYVVRVGGDFMHGRMLLPAWFAILLPVAVIAGSRKRRIPWLALLIVPWAVTCAVALRVPYIGVGKDGLGPNGIADERWYYTERINLKRPVTLADFATFGWAAEGRHFRRLAEQKRVLLPWRSDPKPGDRGRTKEMDLSARTPSRVVINRGHVGMISYGAGLDVHVVDRLGLADALAARIALPRRGRPGHEKDLPDEWVVARFARIAETGANLEPKVRDARDALRCGDLAELVQAVQAPLSPARFARNIALAFRLSALRIARDPSAAKAALCR
jgi:arabinofuranosyltransferase